MGVTDSKLQETSSSDDITTISSRSIETDDPLAQKLKNLQIEKPLLKSPPPEVGLKDVILRHAYGSELGSLDPTTTASLLTLYQEWQRVTADKINKNQEDLKDKIDVVEALALKLLQRFNSSLHMMKSSAADLEDAHVIKTELSEIKSRLNEAVEKYSALEKKINLEGPDFLKDAAKPLPFSNSNNGTQ